ncbi:MAG: DUF362 domain-containing protein [Deltaproteobacteria bacterium]
MHRVMIQPASYDNCAEAVDRAFERFPLEMAGAIKNSYGILPGAQKARLHGLAKSPERFHQVIVEVFRQRVPDLYIMDAVVGMEGNGPASSDLREIGLILAADNTVAMDAVVARMMGLDPGACVSCRLPGSWG